MDSGWAAILGVVVGAVPGLMVSWWVWREEARRDALSRSERAAWMEAAAEERRELYTRIQAWEMPKGDGKKPSQEGEEVTVSAEPPRYTSEELAKLNLRENSDGGYIDASTGDLWESVEDVREWRAELRKRGLPVDLSPAAMEVGGFEAALDEKKNRNS